MTDIVIDSTGVTVAAQDEMLETAKGIFRTAFGDLAHVDVSDSPEGQISRILSEMKSDLAALFLAGVAGLTPSTATGEFLKELIKFNALTQNTKVYSTVVLTCVANSAGTTIPAGSLVSSTGGVQFATDTELVLGGSASGTVTATAVEEGEQTALAASVTSIDTPIYGWASVTNVAAAIVGNLDETDPAMRARRWRAAVGVGLHHESKIKSVLENLADVTAVNVVKTPGYIRAIVRGGADADIAAILFGSYDFGGTESQGAGSVAGGIMTTGSVLVHVVDAVENQEGDIYFDRSTDTNIFIIVRTRKTAGKYPANGDAQIIDFIEQFFAGDLEIEGGLVERPGLGDTIYGTDMAAAARAVPGHKIETVYVGLAAGPTATSVVLTDVQFPVVSAATIVIQGV